MDLSELKYSVPVTPAAPMSSIPEVRSDEDSALSLVTQLAAEVATPLTTALERVIALATTGTIDRQGLHALRTELEAARRASMVSQQITRLAHHAVQQTHERLNLAQMVREVLSARSVDIEARGIQVRQTLKPAEVIVDASLLFGLLQALLDWGLEQSRGGIEFRLDMKSWPAHARITCSFAHRMPDESNLNAGDHGLDTLAWRLVERIARTMQLPLDRNDDGLQVRTTLEFPRTVNESLEGASVIELDHGFAMSGSMSSLAGSQVLVYSARRDVRTQVKHALGHMGLVLDFAGTLEELRDFCADDLPHAIVFESALAGEQFERLRSEWQFKRPDVVFIEITEQGHDFEMSSFDGAATARVGRDAIVSSLPSALMFELAKGY